MIRFDDVPIAGFFDFEETLFIKINEFSAVMFINENKEIGSHYFKPDEMVELVDKCKDCKHYEIDFFRHCAKLEGMDMSCIDPETFKCSKWGPKE